MVPLVGLLASLAQSQCPYSAVAIQHPACDGSIVGTAINDIGHVAGRYTRCGSDLMEAFLWGPDDRVTTLPRPPGVLEARAHDINDCDEIVGTQSSPGFRGFVYNHRSSLWTELPPVTPSGWSFAIGLNNDGTIVGQRSLKDGVAPLNAFVWQDGRFIDLGLLGVAETGASDINQLGHTIGWRGNPGVDDEVFRLIDGEIEVIRTIEGSDSSSPADINVHGTIAMVCLLEDEKTSELLIQSVLWQDGAIIPLGTLPGYQWVTAIAMNDNQQVVGQLIGSGGRQIAFLWQEDEMFDLNALVDLPEGTLTRAVDINNRGEILATGGGRTHVLSPRAPPLGDLDGDCQVSATDLLVLLEQWGSHKSAADLDGSGSVGFEDLLLLLANWTR